MFRLCLKPSFLLALCSLSLFSPAVWAQNSDETLGQYEQIKVFGPSLEGNLGGNDPLRDVSIYLPPDYLSNTDTHYPVVYLLHGFTDTDANWFGLNGEHFVNVQTAVDLAWQDGGKEMIIVMPNAFSRFWGSMYSNSVTTGDWETFVAKDLVTYIDEHYRTLAQRESRGIAGHSMGGYGALRIGMKYPDVFASIYAMSPCCMSPTMEPSQEQMASAALINTEEEIANANFGIKAMLASAAAWSPNPNNPPFYYDLPIVAGEVQNETVAKWAANAPLTMVHQYVPALKQFEAILIDAGDRDVGINATVHSLDATLTDYGIEHTAEEYSGDHVSAIEERLTTKLIPLFSESLVFE